MKATEPARCDHRVRYSGDNEATPVSCMSCLELHFVVCAANQLVVPSIAFQVIFVAIFKKSSQVNHGCCGVSRCPTCECQVDRSITVEYHVARVQYRSHNREQPSVFQLLETHESTAEPAELTRQMAVEGLFIAQTFFCRG